MKAPPRNIRHDLIGGSSARGVRDYETKQPRIDKNGAPLFTTLVVALFGGESEIIPVA